MDTRSKRAARRIAAALLLAGGLGGCVYAPPYAAYDPYYGYSYPVYGYPTYVGPPVTLDFGFYDYGHGGYHGWRGHGGGWGHGWGGRH
jgi:hypothetical protein